MTCMMVVFHITFCGSLPQAWLTNSINQRAIKNTYLEAGNLLDLLVVSKFEWALSSVGSMPAPCRHSLSCASRSYIMERHIILAIRHFKNAARADAVVDNVLQ